MSSITIESDQLISLRDHLRTAADIIDVRLAEGTAEPVTTGPEDWAEYLNRYQDLKKYMEGKPRHVKKRFAEMHYERYGKREGRIWGDQKRPTSGTIASLPSIASVGNRMLWKPIAESRGGVPVVLTPPSWNQVERIRLYRTDGQEISIPGGVEERGKTNGGRETYFFHGIRASQLPANTVISFDDYGRYVIPDPTQRYE